MKITYDLELKDTEKILHIYGLEHNGSSKLYAANRAFIRMQKYVPYDTGALSLTATVKPESVTYEMPYARRQYYENKGDNEGIRGARWDRKMWSAEGDLFTQEVANYIKAKGGWYYG